MNEAESYFRSGWKVQKNSINSYLEYITRAWGSNIMVRRLVCWLPPALLVKLPLRRFAQQADVRDVFIDESGGPSQWYVTTLKQRYIFQVIVCLYQFFLSVVFVVVGACGSCLFTFSSVWCLLLEKRTHKLSLYKYNYKCNFLLQYW